jgi:pantoate--beta-alanine ligase
LEIVTRAQRMTLLSREARARGERIGLVPTMGALHDGHLSLVRRARQVSTLVVMSVFVNPTQFAPGEDFARYPRDLARDSDLAREAGTAILYAPEAREVYPGGFGTAVSLEGLDSVLEGASRPGHFRGVATVVAKLLNRVVPHVALFGQKDAQQAIIIRRMVRDLEMDVEIEVCPTVRESDGLALSSRNVFLGPEERRAAPVLYRALRRAESAIVSEEERDPERILSLIRETVAAEPPVSLEYAAVVDGETLQPLERIRGRVLIPLAARLGATRLIDNILVKVEE